MTEHTTEGDIHYVNTDSQTEESAEIFILCALQENNPINEFFFDYFFENIKEKPYKTAYFYYNERNDDYSALNLEKLSNSFITHVQNILSQQLQKKEMKDLFQWGKWQHIYHMKSVTP